MSISPRRALMDAIACSLPTEPGYIAPRALYPVDAFDPPLPTLADTAVERRMAAKQRDKEKRRIRRVSSTVLDAVVHALTTQGPATIVQLHGRLGLVARSEETVRLAVAQLVHSGRATSKLVRRESTRQPIWQFTLTAKESP